METFSTVLFIDSVPFGYTVRRTPDRLECHPAGNMVRTTTPPHLSAECRNGVWSVDGTGNKELIHQVMEEAAKGMPITPYSDFSAAL